MTTVHVMSLFLRIGDMWAESGWTMVGFGPGQVRASFGSHWAGLVFFSPCTSSKNGSAQDMSSGWYTQSESAGGRTGMVWMPLGCTRLGAHWWNLMRSYVKLLWPFVCFHFTLDCCDLMIVTEFVHSVMWLMVNWMPLLMQWAGCDEPVFALAGSSRSTLPQLLQCRLARVWGWVPAQNTWTDAAEWTTDLWRSPQIHWWVGIQPQHCCWWCH